MAVAVQTPQVQDLDIKTEPSTEMKTASEETGTQYWWRTSGGDLANMMHEANYPEEAQRNFLTYYRNHLCPLLGGKPGPAAVKSSVAWDGCPISPSFEIKGSLNKKTVRFSIDLSDLRPADTSNPLSIKNTQKIVDELGEKTVGFDNTWYHILKKYFVYDHLGPNEQKDLIAKAGQQTSVMLGFDIYPNVSEESSKRLPVLGKVYFPPCYVAADKGITPWRSVYQALEQLPDISTYPNVMKSANMINDYLSDKPRAWQMATRYLATDLVHPSEARFKVYMRCFGTTFDEIWDFYTLGGRLSAALDEDREKFRDLMDMVSGTTYAATRAQHDTDKDMGRLTSATQKITTCYFAISTDRPTPVPKLCVYPSNFAPNDKVVALGLDQWFTKYGWSDGSRPLKQQIETIL